MVTPATIKPPSTMPAGWPKKQSPPGERISAESRNPREALKSIEISRSLQRRIWGTWPRLRGADIEADDVQD